jgi:hypothetical protein
MNQAFSLGQIVGTPGALEMLQAHDVAPATLLERHGRGDWGEIDPEDRGLNEQAVVIGARLLSVYQIAAGVCVWVITEAADEDGERAATTILLPDEY